MPKKETTIYLCNECGYESGKWLGCCPSCGSWNSLSEYTPPKELKTGGIIKSQGKAMPLSEVSASETVRISTHITELDRVLGGGIVPAMAVLIGGDPGIGKSTLLMRVCSELTHEHKVLYVTGEESAVQLKMRAERLGADRNMLVLSENLLDVIIRETNEIKPEILIIDSIQTISDSNCSGAAGAMSQIRECTAALLQYTKANGIALFIVGHVTKEGAIAGPRMLEHMVDTVLYFEGERHDSLRLLRAVKNRFGSTNEIGVFEMTDTGIDSVNDTASMFLSERNLPGCAVTVTMEGTRPIPVEIQALISQTPMNNPRRMANGIDAKRLQLLLAVLEQKAGMKFYDKDVYVNAVGGIYIDDRASDLALCMAITSAYRNVATGENVVYLGEVGLTGEVRQISRLDARLNECERMGFDRVFIPKTNHARNVPQGTEVVHISNISEAINKSL